MGHHANWIAAAEEDAVLRRVVDEFLVFSIFEIEEDDIGVGTVADNIYFFDLGESFG